MKFMSDRSLLTGIFLLVLLSGQACFANPRPLSYPWTGETALMTIIIDCAVDFCVLAIGYLVIGRLRLIASKKFLLYFLLVVLGGFLIDAGSMNGGIDISLLLGDFLMTAAGINAGIALLLVAAIPATLLLFACNAWLSRKFFSLTLKKAANIGILMCILTNPFLYLFVREPFYETYYRITGQLVSWSEGKAAMGSIATAIKAYAAEHEATAEIPVSLAQLGFEQGDFDGTDFTERNYSFNIESLEPLKFTIAVRRDDLGRPWLGKKIIREVTLDQAGNWSTKRE